MNYFAETQEMLKLLHLMNYLKEPNLLLNIKKTNRWRASFQLAQPQTLPKKIGRNPKNKRAKKKGGGGNSASLEYFAERGEAVMSDFAF